MRKRKISFLAARCKYQSSETKKSQTSKRQSVCHTYPVKTPCNAIDYHNQNYGITPTNKHTPKTKKTSNNVNLDAKIIMGPSLYYNHYVVTLL